MIEKILNSKNRIYYHILFWMAYVALYNLMWGSYDEQYWEQFQQLLFLLPALHLPLEVGQALKIIKILNFNNLCRLKNFFHKGNEIEERD